MKKAIIAVSTVVALSFGIEKIASATYLGVISQSKPLTLYFDNSTSGDAAAVTITYIGKNIDTDTLTIPRGEVMQFTITKWPRGTTRLIVFVDTGTSATVMVRSSVEGISGGTIACTNECTATFDITP